MTLGEKINAANAEALKIILGAQPTLIGVGTAGEDIPGMTKKTILHSGPPVTWENMCDPTKGAVIGALIYEGLAKTPEEAEKLAASGEITFDPCHHHNAVGPMCGIVSYSMPVWKVINKAHGNMAYCTFNEGLGKVLRFGAYDDTVITRLHWLRNEFYPVIKEALEIRGEIDLKVLIAQELQMGDDGHNRNRAGTSLLIRELAPAIVKTHFDQDVKVRALEFPMRLMPGARVSLRRMGAFMERLLPFGGEIGRAPKSRREKTERRKVRKDLLSGCRPKRGAWLGAGHA